MIVDGKQIN